MKKLLILISLLCYTLSAAYQYNIKGNQGRLSFDSETTLSFQVDRSGKDKQHQNYIDKGEGILDYGWYDLNTGKSGSLANGIKKTFTQNDNIGLYITDVKGNTYLSTKPKSPFQDDKWGKSRLENGLLIIGGGNFGSNGTHEYYVFKINSVNDTNKTPNGQPLPGIFATLILGVVILFYLKYRKKLLAC